VSKTKHPRADAIEVAREICRRLEGHTERVIVAGSLRRMKAEVSDVEVVFVPKRVTETDPSDMFGGQVEVDATARVIGQMLSEGILAKRLNTNGSPTWGQFNRLAVHVASGIPVDLFATDAKSWWNYVCCRTGPAELNAAIATRARERRYTWHITGDGFYPINPDGSPDASRAPHRVTCERDVFEFVNIPYMEPKDRK